MEAERVEQARIQAELDAKKAEDEERKRIEEERRQGREKEKRESAEQQLRVEQLAHTLHLIKNMQEANWNTNYKEKIDLEWEQYLKCDGLPNPIKPAEMNTYLHLWDQVLHNVSVDQVRHRTSEIIALLEVLQDFIDDPFDASDSLISDWKWVRALCREHQQENIDMATYHLLRDIDSRLHRIDIPTADFHINEENFNLSLWLYVQLATPMYNPRAPIKKRLDIEFEEMGLNVLFPLELDMKCLAIRATYLKYDHLSDTCVLYNRPAIPADIDKDIGEAAANEWARKMWYKWKHRPPPVKKMVEDAEGNMIEVEEPEPEILPGELPPTVPWQKLEPTASANELETENELYKKIRRKLCIEVSDKIVNLRKYLIIGGIYCIDLFYQPPQPHDQVAFDIRITSLQIPKRLYEVPFYIGYTTPTGDNDAKKPPEELEEQMKRQEVELDKLMLVTLTLPEHVMFLDLPTVCYWNKKRRFWTTEDVHDLKHIEEKNYMTFRTGRFGQFALAVNRYINFPFQAWELKPEADGSVSFQITCAILMVEFNIKENRVCLTQLQNSPNNALQDIVGTYFKLPKLIRILQTGGVDLFPACDAFCYIEGTCEKHWPTERHLYYNMALLSPSFNFAWSRWNNQAGRRSIVIQMREYKLNSTKQKNHSTLLVTPLKALFVETTEVSPVFSEIPAEGMKFYSDLFNVMKGTSTMATRNKVQNGSPDVAKTLADLLIMTRVVSFS
ncbi:lung adenoma susceptibility 1-related [Holotrichia oblita]|uniref:Lung adenoma susceptibility 1-related n=1 Tax=Holotrichia oblita TaxID=644536 RepID=A0ACB9SJ08_HOLOL|nr:lung adenoma susceptibility 1-related [Holotrichia oblita]